MLKQMNVIYIVRASKPERSTHLKTHKPNESSALEV